MQRDSLDSFEKNDAFSSKSSSTRRSVSSKSHRFSGASSQSQKNREKPVCPCDALKPDEDVTLSTQCLCEEVDCEQELILYFYNAIMEKVLVKEYIHEVVDVVESTTSFISAVSSAVTENPNFFRKENKKLSKAFKELAPIPDTGKKHERLGSRSTKRKTQAKKKKGSSNSLRPITEDNLIDAERMISTTYFEYDWLVERNEKYAKIIFKNGNIYEGEVVDKVPHGKGTFWWSDGTVYEGDFQDGTPTGKGIMQLPDMTEYKGSFYRGFFHGHGVYNIRSTTILYSGGWKYGKKHGDGWLFYGPGVWYEGAFEDDLRHGRGFFQFGNGSCYEGTYVRNNREGQGAMRWSNNDIYIGDWSEGKFDGYGEYSWKTNSSKCFLFPVHHFYKGAWIEGERTGTGIMFFGTENGAKMAGHFHKNAKHGAALLVCGDGRSIERNPLFFNDKPLHLSTSVDDLMRDSSTSISNNELFETFKPGESSMQWPSDSRLSELTAHLIEHSQQEEELLCNPIEIQINSPPEDIELSFYIEKALKMYMNAFDTIQFDFESSESSNSSEISRIQLSKWNLLTESQYSKTTKPETTDPPLVFDRSSIGQENGAYNISDSKFQSTLRSEDKYLRNVIIRHLPKLMEVYYHYATITSPTKIYFKHFMVRMFLWQLYLDIGITKMGISLVEIDKLLEENPSSFVECCHHPFEHIYFFQFIQSLLGTSILVHQKNKEEIHSKEGLTPYIFQKFLLEILFINTGSHQGRCLFDFKNVLPIKNVYSLYLKLGEPHSARTFLNRVCTQKGKDPRCHKATFNNKEPLRSHQYPGNNVNVGGHNFLFLQEKEPLGRQPEEPLKEPEKIDPFFQDLSTFRCLGPKVIVQCLCSICPPISKNGVICNMDYPLTFLEFFEVLICCTLLVIAKSKKKEELLRKLATEDFKMDDDVDVESASKKGYGKFKKKK